MKLEHLFAAVLLFGSTAAHAAIVKLFAAVRNHADDLEHYSDGGLGRTASEQNTGLRIRRGLAL